MDRPATKKIMVDGAEMFESVDGSQHKTRSGAYKRTHRVWAKANEPEPDPEPEPSTDVESSEPVAIDDEEPKQMTFKIFYQNEEVMILVRDRSAEGEEE